MILNTSLYSPHIAVLIKICSLETQMFIGVPLESFLEKLHKVSLYREVADLTLFQKCLSNCFHADSH